MELHLEVVLLSTIKRKKPWPRFCWLGLEKESVFLLDDNRISEINMVSGRTKKKIPKLQPLLQRVVTMTGSQNGMWLAGLLISGEVFLWSRDRDCLKTINTAPAVCQFVTAAHEASVRLSLLVSGDGRRVLLTALTGQVFLWQCITLQDLAGVRDGAVNGHWAQILPLDATALPSPQDKEASHHSVFAQGEAVGDCCLSAFVFTAGEQLMLSFLKIQWEEDSVQRPSPTGYSVSWATRTYPLTHLSPPCRPVKSRGALVPAFSPDGQLLAIALNQRDPRATQVLFVSTQNFVSVSSGLGGCGSKNFSIPSKYIRSYWVGAVSWTPGGLYLACVLKRGSLLLLARLGGLISLSTSGCNVEFGPAHFLPLHPLVTYRRPVPLFPNEASLSSSCASTRDVLRQRYSVTWHPRLPYLIVSDGYMATVLRVPVRPSPTALVSNLLAETVEGLERVRKALANIQPQGSVLLESLATLKLTVSLQELQHKDMALCTLPLFLRDDGDSRDIQELLTRTQDDSDDEGSQFPGSQVEDRGRLEFASMFDTLHAQAAPGPGDRYDPEDPADSEEGTLPLLVELERVQRIMLTAWALGVSLGGVLQHRRRLLRYVVRCALHLAALLQLVPPAPCNGEEKGHTQPSRVLRLFRTLLSLVPWDTTHSGQDSCLGVVVELTRQIIHLLLFPPADPPQPCYGLFSHTLSRALLVLRLASHSLDHTYCLQKKAVHHPPDLHGEPTRHFSPSDKFSVPFLQDEERGAVEGVSESALLCRHRPSGRLLGVWRVLYQQALHYRAELLGHTGHAHCKAELGRILHILSHIQEALQGAGDQLGAAPTLRSVAGEQHFLLGSYAESAQVWRAELCAEKERGSTLTYLLETRYCLSLLYGLLFQYRLREAQGLCDHMVRQLVQQNGEEPEDQADPAGEGDQFSVAWLPEEVGREAACAVVQSLGRFMAAYFTNQPLTILPPHSVDVLPPLHLPPAACQRLVPLSQSTVLGAVRRQQLSEVWTVEYTLDLLLQGGLLPEAVWLAHHLGDWKTAVFLGLAYTTYCKDHFDFTKLKWRELHLPAQFQPGGIFQDQLESLLGLETGPLETQRDSMEEEDMELLQVSVQEILKASVMVEVDVLSQPLHRLLHSARDLATSLSGLVPAGVYLPAPPLYCPQPATDIEGSTGDVGLVSERLSRQQVSGVLQRVLLLLRAARCSRPAAQWYITSLQRCRQLVHKKCSQPLNSLPDGLMSFVTSNGFFRPKTYSEGRMDTVTVQVIACFRELCGLCWMLHVRDQLSVSCRKYQAARNQDGGSDVVSCCKDALLWACRLLPFSRFLKAEEILQDLVLSLVSELPPIPMVVKALARAFPEEEESVRVPLREKYSSLLQRLRHHTLPVTEMGGVKEEEREEKEEMMTVLIQGQLKHRRRYLRQVGKHLGPLKQHIWERTEEEEEEGAGAASTFDRFSLGASLSRSTLSDCGYPQVYSDGDVAATPSELLSSDSLGRPIPSKQLNAQCRRDAPKGPACKGDASRRVESEGGHGRVKEPSSRLTESPTLPTVGTWEFELEDEEYPPFLELFLSYVIERDRAEGEDSALPFLSHFAPQLQDRELHSLAFDVLTTVKRRKTERQHPTGRGGSAGHLFRAGHCYQPLPHPPDPLSSSALHLSVCSGSQVRSREVRDVGLFPGLCAGKPRGLFGLRQPNRPITETPAQRAPLGSEASHGSTIMTPQSDLWPFKTLPALDVPVLQQELDPKMEARFRGLSRLLEWMVRWADRRVLLGHPSRRREGGAGAGPGGVVIRAKASAPAVLTALRLLESRYTAALLGTDKHSTHFRVPERQFIVAPVRPEMRWKSERDSSVDTGYPGSAGTPVTLPPQDSQHGDPSEVSDVVEVEPEVDLDRALHQCDQEEVTSDTDSKAEEDEECQESEKLSFIAEQEGDSTVEVAWEDPQSVSAPSISIQIKTLPRIPSSVPDQPLTLDDLESRRDEALGSLSQTVESESHQLPSKLTNVSADLMAEASETTPARDEPQGPNPMLQPNPCLFPELGIHPGPPTSSALQPERSSETQPPMAQLEPVRQLLQDELIKLLQQINFISLMQVMGTSFTNLPLLSQHQPQPQPQPPIPHLLQPNLPLLSQHQPQPQPQPPIPHLLQPNLPLLAQLQPQHQPQPQPQPPISHLPQPNLPLLPQPQLQPQPQPPIPHLPQSSQPPGAPFSQPRQESPEQPGHQHPGVATLAPGLQPSGGQHSDQQLESSHPRSVKGYQSNMENMTENGSEFPVRLEWEMDGHAENEDFIPSSRELSSISPDSASTPPPLHLGLPLLSSTGHTRDGPRVIPPASGIRLLQLHPPVSTPTGLLQTAAPPPSASAQQVTGCGTARAEPTLLPPVLLSVSQADALAVRQAAEKRMKSPERPLAGPPKHLGLEQCGHTTLGQATGSAWPQRRVPDSRVEGRERERGAPVGLPLAAQSHRTPPSRGLPLLHLNQEPHLPATVPHIPLSNPTRPLASGLGFSRHFTGLQLLQIDPEPLPKVLPLNPLPLPTPHLIPPEELMGLAARGRWGTAVGMAPFRFLKADTRPRPADTTANSSKRQKRRDDKKKEGEKASVTFRLEESIIPPAELEEAEPTGTILEEDLGIPIGSSSSMLTGQSLITNALSTVAELHAFASSQKKPPEIKDMCTNTESAPPPSLADKAVSAQLPVALPSAAGTGDLEAETAAMQCPDVFLNLRFPREPLPQEPECPETAAQVVDVDGPGRHFINVIDLEDESLLQHLPNTAQNRAPSPPTSAQLHLLAASVVNSSPVELPVADPMTAEVIQDAQLDPSVKSSPPAAQAEQAASEPEGEKATFRLPMEREAWSMPPPQRQLGERSMMSRSQVSAKLSRMDSQLAALQRIADHMDREFASTRMLISTIETMGTGKDPRVERQQYSSRSFHPGVTEEVSRVCRSIGLADLQEEKDEDEVDAQVIDTSPTPISPPGLKGHTSFSAASAVESTSFLHSSAIGSDTMAAMSGKWADDVLSPVDTADILEELLGVEGISASALGLSDTQAERLSRLGEQRREDRADRERQKVRAWMRKKQRERLAEYRRQRDERREREHRPFMSSATVTLTSRDLSINRKIKERKEKMLLQEHHTQRAQDACNLISELLTASPALPTATTQPLSQSRANSSARLAARSRSKSAGRKGGSTQPQGLGPRSLSSPGRVAGAQSRAASGGRPMQSDHLGLHRPASALPGDRLSQVTRRGMLTDVRGRTPVKGWGKEVGPFLTDSSRAGDKWVKNGVLEKQKVQVGSHWKPLEVHRLQGLEELNLGQELMVEVEESSVIGRGGKLRALDSLSESTGSILSKLDWTAIENLLAEEEGD
ncbi:ciliogenesis and planar polarity effector 1 [Megalops cyprinoides]|uniref:ciliogenesis and planar polarity effector 1 n=1 Tax=Megalops cyprinoides TaxID=118141 RepID=UPI001864FAF0|nr:ciliogenesis and planar polarity effector 1 [Megalops cyprinoides]